MKNVLRFVLSVVVSLTFVNCSDDGGGGGGSNKKAKAPNRNGCLYDTRTGQYRERNGDLCDYREYYDENACYNYYFNPHTPYTRNDDRYFRDGYRDYDGYFTDNRGKIVNCDLQYIGSQNFYPYYFHHPQQGYVYGCQWWGTGLYEVPLGNGGYVCVYNSTNYYNVYNSPGWNYYNNYYGGYYGPGYYYEDNRSFGDFAKDLAIGAAGTALIWGLVNGF